MEITLSQPAPQPQCDPSPRRAAVDTGSEKPGTPRRSPAIGTGSVKPGVSRIETSTEEAGFFPLEPCVDGSLHSNCTSPEQVCILLHKPDVGVDDEKETTDTSQQATVHERFARQRRSASGKGRKLELPSKASNLTGAGHSETILPDERYLSRILFARCLCPSPCALSAFYCCVFFPPCP